MHFSCLYLSYILFVILICSTISECALTPEEIRGLHLNRKYCGSRLSEAMKQVCDPTVRDFFLNKIVDGSADIAFEKYLSNYYANKKRTDNVVSNDIPLLFPSQLRRQRRGITDECCKKACSITELSQYCPPTWTI